MSIELNVFLKADKKQLEWLGSKVIVIIWVREDYKTRDAPITAT